MPNADLKTFALFLHFSEAYNTVTLYQLDKEGGGVNCLFYTVSLS